MRAKNRRFVPFTEYLWSLIRQNPDINYLLIDDLFLDEAVARQVPQRSDHIDMGSPTTRRLGSTPD
eukprot:936937-Prorocentrum_lima.AAC.1